MSDSDAFAAAFAVLIILGIGMIASIGWVIIRKLNCIIRLLFDIRTQAWREIDIQIPSRKPPSVP